MAFFDKYKPGQQQNTLSPSNNNQLGSPIFGGFPQVQPRQRSFKPPTRSFLPRPNLREGMLGQNRPDWRKAPLGGRSLSGGPLGGGLPSFTSPLPTPTIGGQEGPALGHAGPRPPEGPRGFMAGPVNTNWGGQLEMWVRNYWAENPGWDPAPWIAERLDIRGPIIERIKRERGF